MITDVTYTTRHGKRQLYFKTVVFFLTAVLSCNKQTRTEESVGTKTSPPSGSHQLPPGSNETSSNCLTLPNTQNWAYIFVTSEASVIDQFDWYTAMGSGGVNGANTALCELHCGPNWRMPTYEEAYKNHEILEIGSSQGAPGSVGNKLCCGADFWTSTDNPWDPMISANNPNNAIHWIEGMAETYDQPRGSAKDDKNPVICLRVN